VMTWADAGTEHNNVVRRTTVRNRMPDDVMRGERYHEGRRPAVGRWMFATACRAGGLTDMPSIFESIKARAPW